MYEVKYLIPSDVDLKKLFDAAHMTEEERGTGTDDIVDLLSSRVFNAVGSPPARPQMNALSYSNGARGPTPNISAFQPASISVTFPAQLVSAGDGSGIGANSGRYYLPDIVAQFFNAMETLNMRRPDLSLELGLGLEIRRLFEQNDPGNDSNQADATALYSAVDFYPHVIVTWAGGDDGGFTVQQDVLKRPLPVSVENYVP